MVYSAITWQLDHKWNFHPFWNSQFVCGVSFFIAGNYAMFTNHWYLFFDQVFSQSYKHACVWTYVCNTHVCMYFNVFARSRSTWSTFSLKVYIVIQIPFALSTFLRMHVFFSHEHFKEALVNCGLLDCWKYLFIMWGAALYFNVCLFSCRRVSAVETAVCCEVENSCSRRENMLTLSFLITRRDQWKTIFR